MVYYNDFKELKISSLGFGTLRLPLKSKETGEIDQTATDEMIDIALEGGVNYFDLAYTYHNGKSEKVVGKSLSRYPRQSYFLADKFPGYEIMSNYDCDGIFKDQLNKCQTSYFDFYLFHNVNENSIKTYLDKRWGIHDYFKAQKEEGRIGHIGFSCHGDIECIEKFLDSYGDIAEFCQIQLNYLDWTLQDGKSKYEYLTKIGMPIWVMEPVRGGKLSSLDEETEKALHDIRPDASIPSWAFRFLQGLPNVKVVLSGMSTLSQVKDNISTFEKREALSDEETKILFDAADRIKNAVPCTGCGYCLKGCPMQIDIPKMISLYNESRYYRSANISMRVEAIEAGHTPTDCIECRQCAKVCPQKIDAASLMPKIAQAFSEIPTWTQLHSKKEKE